MYEVKRLYDEANRLYERAKAILDEYKDGNMPAEKAQEVDRLLDEVEAKTQEAKRLERAAQLERLFNEPGEHLPLGGGGSRDEMGWKALLARAGYGEKAMAYFAGSPAEEVKRALATAQYIKGGLEAVEEKGLLVSEGTAGGFLLAQPQKVMFLALKKQRTVMRQLARVLPPTDGTVTPTVAGRAEDAEWTYEVGQASEDKTKPFTQRMLKAHPLAKMRRVSRAMLRSATVADAEQFVMEQLADAVTVAEEKAFIQGDGARKPLGLLAAKGIAKKKTASAGTLTGDDIINWAYSLPAAYSQRATILCSQAFLRKVRLLKDNNGQYIWQPGLQAGQPGRILDFPYAVSDFYPTGLDANDAYKSGEIIATIGDFSYYWIVDGLDMGIQRLDELFAQTNEVGFIIRQEADGMPVLGEAFLHLQVA